MKPIVKRRIKNEFKDIPQKKVLEYEMNKAVKEHEDAVMDNNNYLSDKIFKKYIEIRNKYICLSSSSR